MKKLTILPVLFLLLAFQGLPSQEADRSLFTSYKNETITLAGFDPAILESGLFVLIQEEREKARLSPLEFSTILHTSAADYAGEMAKGGFLSPYHPSSPEKKTIEKRISLAGKFSGPVAENLSGKYLLQVQAGMRIRSPSKKGEPFRDGEGKPIPYHTYGSLAGAIVQEWMGDPVTKANILSTNYRYPGTGVASVEGDSIGAVRVAADFAVSIKEKE